MRKSGISFAMSISRYIKIAILHCQKCVNFPNEPNGLFGKLTYFYPQPNSANHHLLPHDSSHQHEIIAEFIRLTVRYGGKFGLVVPEVLQAGGMLVELVLQEKFPVLSRKTVTEKNLQPGDVLRGGLGRRF